MAPTHDHLSSNIIKAQVNYQSSPAALETARRIVRAKIRNAEFLLSRYLRSRTRSGYDSAEQLNHLLNKLHSLRSATARVAEYKGLFLLEARAAKLYWSAFGLIGHLGLDWRRVYPKAEDIPNLLLNSGYTILARQILKAIKKTGLLPEVGLYHAQNSADPLIYDLMEIFRLPAVDLVILPTLSRRFKKPVGKDGPIFKKILANLNYRYNKKFSYRGHCERLERIIELETIKFKQAVKSGLIWEPYRHDWSHRKICP